MPDGRLLFLSDRSGGIGIWTSRADGSDADLVIDLGDASAVMPASSANGHLVTFASDVHEPGSDRNVYSIRMDGTGLARLTINGDDLSPHFAGELSSR
jgi:Tol biopolymer transport system component